MTPEIYVRNLSSRLDLLTTVEWSFVTNIDTRIYGNISAVVHVGGVH